MAEWMNIQQSSTLYCVNHRTKIINTTLDCNSGNDNFARSPTLLKAFKRAVQEVLCCGRWYGTMPIGCMAVWVIETTDREEVKARGDENKRKKEEKKREKENKRKSRKERKIMRNYADALRPRQSPIAKPNTKITTKTPGTTSRKAHTTKSNTATTTSNTSRTC
jgi:hypothetical protein